MDLSRRRFLVLAGHSLALGGTGLLVACQSPPQQQIQVTVAPAATSAPTARPAIQPVASVSPATVAPAAAASPLASPAAKPAASPAPAAVAVASPAPLPVAAAVAGKPMYQMDALHTGRSLHAGPRRLG